MLLLILLLLFRFVEIGFVRLFGFGLVSHSRRRPTQPCILRFSTPTYATFSRRFGQWLTQSFQLQMNCLAYMDNLRRLLVPKLVGRVSIVVKGRGYPQLFGGYPRVLRSKITLLSLLGFGLVVNCLGGLMKAGDIHFSRLC